LTVWTFAVAISPPTGTSRPKPRNGGRRGRKSATRRCFVGFKGECFRFYLSDEGYRNAKHSEQEGEIKIKSHAAVTARSVLLTADNFRFAPIIMGDATLPLRWRYQLPLCRLAARNHLALQVGSVRQILQNPAIFFQRENI